VSQEENGMCEKRVTGIKFTILPATKEGTRGEARE